MYNVFQTPIFGIVISVLFFCFSTGLSKKIKNPLLNPLLITIFSIILFLLIFDIDYKNRCRCNKLLFKPNNNSFSSSTL